MDANNIGLPAGEDVVSYIANLRIGILECVRQSLTDGNRIGVCGDTPDGCGTQRIIRVVDKGDNVSPPLLANGVEYRKCPPRRNLVTCICHFGELWDGRGRVRTNDFERPLSVVGECIFSGYKVVEPCLAPELPRQVAVKRDDSILCGVICDATNEQRKVVRANDEKRLGPFDVVGARKPVFYREASVSWFVGELSCKENQERQRRAGKDGQECEASAAEHGRSMA